MTPIRHRQTWNIGGVQSGLTSVPIVVECRCISVLVSSSSSADFLVWHPVCWKGDWGAASVASTWMGAHTYMWSFQLCRSALEDKDFSHQSYQYKLSSSSDPSSSDVATSVGFHLAVYLPWSSDSVDPVVPRWSNGVAVMYLLAGGGRVLSRDTFAGEQLCYFIENAFLQLPNHGIWYCTKWPRTAIRPISAI